jgi:hypothetical protein
VVPQSSEYAMLHGLHQQFEQASGPLLKSRGAHHERVERPTLNMRTSRKPSSVAMSYIVPTCTLTSAPKWSRASGLYSSPAIESTSINRANGRQAALR